MSKKSVDTVFKRYRTNMGNAGERIKEGIELSDKSQSAEAIKAIPKMKENLIKSIDSGKVKAGLLKSGDEKWKKNLIAVGVPKITLGIDANEAEIKEKMGKVIDVGDMVHQAIKDMPNNSIEDALAIQRVSMEIQRREWGKT